MLFEDAINAVAEANPMTVADVPMVPNLTVHVDGDYLAYYAAGNDDTTPGEARLNALNLLDYFRGRIGAERAVVHLTAPNSHKGERYLVATVKPYQGHRSGSRKPKNHGYLQDWLLGYTGDAFHSKVWATREADDGIGACSHYAVGTTPGYAGIATADKDMRMLPGVHINWRNGAVTRVNPGDYEVIGEDGKLYGTKWFLLQMLQGDTADHIPGLEQRKLLKPDGGFHRFEKVGEKTAEKILAGTSNLTEGVARVWQEYLNGYHSEEFAADRFAEQASLLWMRCDNAASVIDFATHAGHSKLPLPNEVMRAAERLAERVTNARQEINKFTDQNGT